MKTLLQTILCFTIYAAVLALPNSAYPFAIAAAGGAIDIKGHNFASDSFDSNESYNGVWNINGYYTNGLRKAGGNVIASTTLTNSVPNVVGNLDIGGKIITGPLGSIAIGPQGCVGDLPWIEDSANIGKIKPGWSTNDFNLVFRDVALPATTWNVAAGPNTGGAGVVNGKFYDHVFNYSGDYSVPDTGTIYVGTNVHVRLLVTVNTFSPAFIYVAGKGALAGKLVAYLTGANATFGTEHMTQSGKAETLVFLGLPTCTAIAYKGNGDFTGVIYAPQADLQLGNGGSGMIDFLGSSLTKTVQLNGHYNFHFDEDLYRGNLFSPFFIALLSAPVLSSNQFQFTVSGVPGFSYIVESSTDCVSWNRLITNAAPFTFSDTNVNAVPQRFFRAVRPPNLP